MFYLKVVQYFIQVRLYQGSKGREWKEKDVWEKYRVFENENGWFSGGFEFLVGLDCLFKVLVLYVRLFFKCS